MPPQDLSRLKPAEAPETERLTLAALPSKDWMSVLDDWHRQLQSRFERLEQLQTRLRRSADGASADGPQLSRREDSAA